MTKVKVKIDCWWSNSFLITDRVLKQFLTNQDLISNIEFVHDDSYDFLMVFGRPNNTNLKSKDKIFCFTMEPLWSPNNTKNLHNISNYVLVHDKRGYEESDAYVEDLVYMLYGGVGELWYSELEYNWEYHNLMNKKFNKTETISFITRNSYESHHNFDTCDQFKIIYRKRVDLAMHLSNNNIGVHIYGLFWEKDINKNIYGNVWNKMFALNNYKFSICAENTIQKNYISEKFWDSILTETIPIYFGCNNISDFIPQLSEFNFTDIIDNNAEIEYRLKEIIKNSDKIYQKYHNIILDLRNEYFNSERYNLLLKIISLINQ